MLEFQVAPNPAPIARETDVLINQERVHVSQDAASCVYSIVPNNQTIPAAGGPGTINVTTLAGCSWNGVADVPWITITGAASGTGNGAIRFSAASNGGALRVGTVTIAGQVATISQPAPVTTVPVRARARAQVRVRIRIRVRIRTQARAQPKPQPRARTVSHAAALHL